MDSHLDPRARRLLRTLIAQHIQDGEPVGSRTLAKRSGLDVSPATIRNIMADLEESGLVAAPHTSAGRIPTAHGYRMFVDSLLQMQPLPEPELADSGTGGLLRVSLGRSELARMRTASPSATKATTNP